MSAEAKNGLHTLLTPEESVLALIDHQPFQFANLNSHEPTMVVNNVVGLAGGVSAEAHDMAVRRMVQAGVVPITWVAVAGEWQRDWAREATVPGLAKVQSQHAGASGVAFAWETQLLAAGRAAGAA